MSENTNIEWTDHTFNHCIGCTQVSPGCLNCYAETLDKRRLSKTLGTGTKEAPVIHWGKGAPRHRTSEAYWKQPLKWERQAARDAYELKETGQVTNEDGSAIAWHRPRVFCASLADWLDDEIPIEWLVDLLDLIRRTPSLDWQLLTKRPQNWKPRLKKALAANLKAWGNEPNDLADWIDGWRFKQEPPANVWIGTTVEDQHRADDRIPHLLDIPARIRFLSCEPLLGPLNLPRWLVQDHPPEPNLHWIITGGESGACHRPFDPQWARDLRDQCKAGGVAFFMKQMGGERKPFPGIPPDLMIRQFPTLT